MSSRKIKRMIKRRRRMRRREIGREGERERCKTEERERLREGKWGGEENES